MRRLCLITVAAGLAFLIRGPAGLSVEEKAVEPPAAVEKAAEKAVEKIEIAEPIVVKMEEVPAFGKEEVDGRTQVRAPNGQMVRCTAEPSKEVKRYPELKSERPMYGSIRLDGSLYDPGLGTPAYFVLDDDQLYFDVNGDLDLTNDGVLGLAKTSPFEGLPGRSDAKVYEDIPLSVDYGPPAGKRPFPIVMQRLTVSPGMAVVQVVPKLARRGTFKIGEVECKVILTQSRLISGRFDRAFVYLELSPVDRTSAGRLPLTSGYLGQARMIDGQLLVASATPLGDELTVGPYRGEMGVLEIGPGGRAITELGAAGSLISRTMMVPLGEANAARTSADLPRRYTLPVGDYLATSITVRHGRLRFNARALLDRDLPPGTTVKPADYAIQIRKDKPFVLNFSGKPEVMFLNPNKEQTFKPGQQVQVRVMLAEPGQGILITGLEDTTKQEGELTARIGGEEVKMPQYARLDPTITIRNSAGEEVATGKMPFG